MFIGVSKRVMQSSYLWVKVFGSKELFIPRWIFSDKFSVINILIWMNADSHAILMSNFLSYCKKTVQSHYCYNKTTTWCHSINYFTKQEWIAEEESRPGSLSLYSFIWAWHGVFVKKSNKHVVLRKKRRSAKLVSFPVRDFGSYAKLR